jgi:O-antigen ligase
VLLVFGFTRVISVIFSHYPSVSIEIFYKEALLYFGFFSMSFYLKLFDNTKTLNIIYALVIASVITSLIGIIIFNLSLSDRAQSFSSGTQAFSVYLLCALSLALFVKPEINNKFSWIIHSSIISIILTGIITALGRTNIIIGIVILSVSIILKRLNFREIALVIFITAGLSAASFQNNSAVVKGRIEQPFHPSDRDILFKGVETLLFKEPVLGFGPRTFRLIFPFKNEFADKEIGSWHNDFLQIYFESGLLGLIAFLSLLGVIFFKNISLIKLLPNKENKNITTGILLSFLCLFLSATTSGFITSAVISIIFVFFVALLSSMTLRIKT